MKKERMIALETKVSYQEHTIQELNDVLINQLKRIDVLENQLNRIREHLKAIPLSEFARPEDEPPPPHY